MLLKLGISLLCLWLLQSSGCESKPAGGQNSPQPAGSAQTIPATNPAGGNMEAKPATAGATEAGGGGDACALIEASEIEAVQGVGVRQSTPSGRASDGLSVAGCYYTVISADGTKNLSVHLEVTRADPAPSAGQQDVLGNLWKEKFEHGIAKKKFDKPKPVDGVGEEAFWLGNNKMGALYVWRKNRMLRVSVGGPDEEDTKIEKSKRLAEKALKRLG